MRRLFPRFLSVALLLFVATFAAPMLTPFTAGALIAGQQKQKPKKETKPAKSSKKETKAPAKSSKKEAKSSKKEKKTSTKTASLKETKGKKGAKLTKAEEKREKNKKETAASSRRGRHEEIATRTKGSRKEREIAARRGESKASEKSRRTAEVSGSRRHRGETATTSAAAENALAEKTTAGKTTAGKTVAEQMSTAKPIAGTNQSAVNNGTASAASVPRRGALPTREESFGDSVPHVRPPAFSATGSAASEPRREVRKPESRAEAIEQQVRPDSTVATPLADGVTHRWMATAGHQVVNVVTIDLKSGARLKSSKALDRCDGLQTACDIGTAAGTMMRDTAVLVATNASFWRAGTNTPIGATINDGEVVEMPGYKRWSSLMIFDNGAAEIDRIELRGTFIWDGRRFPLSAVNRRGNEPGLIVYNRFYGDSIPRGSRKSDSAIVAEAMANRVSSDVGDDTETLDTAAIIRGYRGAKALEDKEFPNLKIACAPLRPKRKRDVARPFMVGDTMRMTVTAIDTGTVVRPENGCVLSAGELRDAFREMKVGDTVSLVYAITPDPGKRVREVLTGTPRLVRDGHAAPEQEIEGSKARRFVDGKLARTAIGISRGGDTLFLVTVNSPSLSLGTTGMSLEQLAVFMRSIGAYQAMNFDGGGSASMAINGAMISLQGNRPSSRRVSNALMVVRPETDAAKKVENR